MGNMCVDPYAKVGGFSSLARVRSDNDYLGDLNDDQVPESKTVDRAYAYAYDSAGKPLTGWPIVVNSKSSEAFVADYVSHPNIPIQLIAVIGGPLEIEAAKYIMLHDPEESKILPTVDFTK
ncbi:MAG: hypothetical protein JW873_05225 [Candidatus Saganbacteria bacterium]|nr:hypothetical protein [Candidatus Saganbacteria bacterium]